jgi:DNA polymerase-1
MNIPFIQEKGVEADDVIGTLSAKLTQSDPDCQCIIVTGDKDFKQMLSNSTSMLIPGKKGAWELFTTQSLIEETGLTPKEFIDYLGLMGDNADNVPGVKGVGKKTAEKLIKEYKSMEGLYENLDKIKGKIKDKIAESRDIAFLSRDLVTIKTDLDINLQIKDMCLKNTDAHALVTLLETLEFKALAKKYKKHFGLLDCKTDTPAPAGAASGVEAGKEYVAASGVEAGKDATSASGKEYGAASGNESDNEAAASGDESPKIAIHHNYILVEKEDINNFIDIALEASEIAFDLETTGLNPRDAEIIGLSFSFRYNKKPGPETAEFINAYKGKLISPAQIDTRFPLTFFIPSMNKIISSPHDLPGQMALFTGRPVEKAVTDNEVLNLLKRLFLSHIPKGGQNIKFDLAMLRLKGLEVKNIRFDTMVESYVIDPTIRSHGIDFLAKKYLDYDKIPTSALIKKGKSPEKNNSDQLPLTMADTDRELLFNYACEDAEITLLLHELFSAQIKERNLSDLYTNIEMPLLKVLLKMELTGFYIDRDFLESFKTDLDQALKELEKKIFSFTGMEFNINSPRQMGSILFEEMNIHEGKGKIKKTKTGFISTDSNVLESYSHVPVVAAILEYRTLNKLLNTYVSALPELIDKKTGRIHSTFNQTVAATGRLSSSNPNLQNIPIRTDLGKKIRRAFKGEKGNIIVSADYSQIELRVLAHLCDDQDLISAFKNDIDIHTHTASRIFKTPIAHVTSQMRSRAKTVNFGVLYGMGPQRLARENNITITEAKQFIEDYFTAYPTIKEYSEKCCETARNTGYASTISGRQRPVPEINSRNRGHQINGEHIALNTPIQGSAADIIKMAMIKIDERLEKELPDAVMICQIHDELVFEAAPEQAEKLIEIIKDCMENVIDLSVPLKVDVGMGKNWFEAH